MSAPQRPPEKQKLILGLVLGMILFALFLLFWAALKLDARSERAAAQAPQAGTESEAVQETQSLKHALDPRDIRIRFENTLNAMLKDVRQEMLTYRDERKVVVEMIQPANIRQPQYVAENFHMLKTVLPDLRAKMDNVVNVFARTEDQINEILKDQPEALSDGILEEWQELKRQHARPYIEYFSFENKILDTHEKLMELYYSRAGEYTVDVGAGTVAFVNMPHQMQADAFLSEIELLKTQQQKALKEDF